MGTVLPWTGGESAEGPPAVHRGSLQDWRAPFRVMHRVQMTHCMLEPLAPAAPPLTEHHLF